MPSFTSSSKAVRAITVLLLALAGLAVTFEAAARTLGVRSSRILTRLAREHEALKGFTSSPAHPKTVAIFGNSLLVEGVDYPAMRQGLAAAGWDSRRFVVEQTAFYDWKYGLKRIFSEGCRPDAVVLVLNAVQMSQNGYAGPSFAYNLLRAEDILDVARTMNVHPTEAANLLLARESAFFGLRFEFRKHIMLTLIPGMPGLISYLAPRFNTFSRDFVHQQVGSRVAELASIAAEAKVRLVLVIPPAATGDDFADELLDAGRKANVPVLYPVRTGDYPASAFQDGFHLTAEGARTYTGTLTPAILAQLESPSH